jgi:uncharacterized protein
LKLAPNTRCENVHPRTQHRLKLKNEIRTDALPIQMSYPYGMDHLEVLREKIGRLRFEIAEIQRLNEQYRREGGNETDAQVAHGQRHERLQAIQQELGQLAALGRKVRSIEEAKEQHRSRLHPMKQVS